MRYFIVVTGLVVFAALMLISIGWAIHRSPRPPEPPKPIDKDAPPKWMKYNPKAGSPQRKCHCHGIDLVPEQLVLVWPRPDATRAFYCQKYVEEVSQR